MWIPGRHERHERRHVALSERAKELLPYLFVGNEDLSGLPIEGQIASMHEERENVVSRREGGEVVSKAPHVHGLPHAGEKMNDGVSETVQRKLEAMPQRLVACRGRPVGLAFAGPDGAVHVKRVVDGADALDLVALVEAAQLGKVPVVRCRALALRVQ